MRFSSTRLGRLFSLHNTLIITFLAMLSFSIFYRRGIEHARYIFLVLAALYFIKERHAFKELISSPPFSALLAFLAVAATGLALNGQPLSNVDEILNWMITFAAGYLAARSLGEHRPLVLMVIPVTLVCVYILHPLLFGQGLEYLNPASPARLQRYFHARPNHLGVICGAAAFTSTCYAIMRPGFLQKTFILLGSGACLFLLFKTGARTSFIATVTVFGVALIWLFRPSWKSLVVIALCLGAGTLGISNSSLQRNRITAMSQGVEQDLSLKKRIFTWTIAKENFLEHPWLGKGFDTFGRQYAAGLSHHSKQDDFRKKFPHTIRSTNNAHNFFLHFLAETGASGLLTMLFFWSAIINIGVRTRDMVAIAVAGMFGIAFIALQLNMSLYGSQVSTMLFGFAGISASIKKGRTPQPR